MYIDSNGTGTSKAEKAYVLLWRRKAEWMIIQISEKLGGGGWKEEEKKKDKSKPRTDFKLNKHTDSLDYLTWKT